MRFRVRKRVWITAMVIALGGVLVWLDPRGPQETEIDSEARAQEPGHVLECRLPCWRNRHYSATCNPTAGAYPQTAMTDVLSPRASCLIANNVSGCHGEHWHSIQKPKH